MVFEQHFMKHAQIIMNYHPFRPGHRIRSGNRIREFGATTSYGVCAYFPDFPPKNSSTNNGGRGVVGARGIGQARYRQKLYLSTVR